MTLTTMRSSGRQLTLFVPVACSMLACGGELENGGNDECVVVRFGITSGGASAAIQPAASPATHCASMVTVQAVRPASGAAGAYGYTVTVANGSDAAADLSRLRVEGYYASSNDAAPTALRCAAALSGSLAAGASEDVAMPCSTGPAADDAYLVVRLGSAESRFAIPE